MKARKKAERGPRRKPHRAEPAARHRATPGHLAALGGFVGRLSLRVKITGGFVFIALLSAAISTVIGSRIVTGAMFNEAQKRVSTGLEAARMVYHAELDRVRRSVVLAASAYRLTFALSQSDPNQIPALLAELKAQHGLDFLTYVGPSRQRWVASRDTGPPKPPLGPTDAPATLALAWSGEPVASTEVLSSEALADESPELGARAHLRITPVPYARSSPKQEVEGGLCMLAAAPVRVGTETVGIIYGGLLLNGSTDLVDRSRQTVFGGELYRGKEVGTVTVFRDDVRVATNVLLASGERAVGTRAQAEVAETVLGRGETWRGRAFVVNAWYVTAYEPILSYEGQIVGMLYVGMDEGPYLAVRTDMMVTFIAVVIAGVFIVLGLTYFTTRGLIHPLEEMVAASRRIAAGDFERRVTVRSADEVGQLASSFNTMQAAVKTMKQELEQSAHTLEERVQARTSELMAIQTQMIQSEKLASLGRMASGVAHEINNPLGGILTFASLALEDVKPDDPLRHNLDIIVKQTLRCRDIVKGLLEFSRRPENVASTADANAVIDFTLSLLEQQAIFHNIHTIRRFHASLPAAGVDPGQLQQVLMNLILNAVDAMEGSGTLTLSTDLREDAGLVVVSVADTGKGIPPENQPLIFEPFFTTKRVGQGTGLGLAIVHGIVTRAGGTIELDTSSKGTRFSIVLPAADPKGTSSAPPSRGSKWGARA